MPQAYIDCWSEEVEDMIVKWFAEAVDVDDDNTVHAGSIADSRKDAIKQCEEEAKGKGVKIVQEF